MSELSYQKNIIASIKENLSFLARDHLGVVLQITWRWIDYLWMVLLEASYFFPFTWSLYLKFVGFPCLLMYLFRMAFPILVIHSCTSILPQAKSVSATYYLFEDRLPFWFVGGFFFFLSFQLHKVQIFLTMKLCSVLCVLFIMELLIDMAFTWPIVLCWNLWIQSHPVIVTSIVLESSLVWGDWRTYYIKGFVWMIICAPMLLIWSYLFSNWIRRRWRQSLNTISEW